MTARAGREALPPVRREVAVLERGQRDAARAECRIDLDRGPLKASTRASSGTASKLVGQAAEPAGVLAEGDPFAAGKGRGDGASARHRLVGFDRDTATALQGSGRASRHAADGDRFDVARRRGDGGLERGASDQRNDHEGQARTRLGHRARAWTVAAAGRSRAP